MRKFFIILLALILVLNLTSALANMNASEYTDVVAQELPDAEDMIINYDDYYGQVIQGYYNFDCLVSEGLYRTAKFYIPENTVYNQPTVFIMVPAGVNTYGFLVESGWKDAADKFVFHVVLMETDESGVWGNIDDEIAYLSALRDDVSYRPFFVSFSSNFYAIAYDNAADVLMKHAMRNPNQWTSVTAVGVTGMDKAYIEELKATPSKEAGKNLNDIPVPVFMVAEERTPEVENLIEYWKEANATEDVQYSCAYADEVYIPAAWTTTEAMDNEPVAKVFFSTAPIEDYYKPENVATIYNDFMRSAMRYPGYGNGALRAFQDIYKAGFVKHKGKVAGGYAEDGSDLYNREWFVYVPDSVNLNEPASVVFVFHGAGGTGDEIAGRTGWIKVANDRGLILVCPTGSHRLSIRNVSDITTNELFRAMWNTSGATAECPDDVAFVRYLVDWVKENHNVDVGRIYATGQSSGGAMSCAVGYYLSDIFTATAPVSAISFNQTNAENALNNPIPIMPCIGTGDPYFAKAGFGSEGEGFSAGKAFVTYWTERYNTVQKWEDFTYMCDNPVYSYQAGIYRNYVFRTKDGVPMVRCVEAVGKAHAYLPSEAYMIWDEFFATFHKDTEGNLFYMNTLVELD
ncbi:MAG: alpha/beta hydrolase family esterase [Christensenellales bacterium]|jgi:poly(3-hydroxybutyrate) depolymerase